jgi:hypothetical protein
VEQAIRALHRKLDLSTYAHDKTVAFTLRSATSTEQAQLESIHVPVPIVYRFYHLGRAYDLNQLKQLQPTGNSSVSFVPLQLLVQELEQVAQFVNDPVIQHYSNLLTQSFKKARHDTSCMLHVCAP